MSRVEDLAGTHLVVNIWCYRVNCVLVLVGVIGSLDSDGIYGYVVHTCTYVDFATLNCVLVFSRGFV